MALNLSGLDPDLYFNVNTSAQVGLFFIAVLPTLILCLLCVVALLFASSINWQMRVVLINIFAADICTWLGLTVLFLGFPLRASVRMGGEWSCSVALSLFNVGPQQKFSITALYAIMVYVFIKYGPRKLKWYAIAPYIGITWVVAIAIGIFPYFNRSLFNSQGFCRVRESTSVSPSSSILVGVIVVFFSVIIVFSLLTGCYVKRNVLEDNVQVKRAIAKNLLFLVISIILTVISNILPASFPAIREAFEDRGLISLVLIDYVIRLFLNLPFVITPIAAIIILKPMQDALKQGFNMLCCCCKKREVAEAQIELEEIH